MLLRIVLVLACFLSWTGSTYADGLMSQMASPQSPRFTASSIVTSDTAILSRPGVLQCIIISQNDAAPTAGSIIIYDNTAESGTQLFNWTLTTTVFTPIQICPAVTVSTGIYVGFTTTADVNVLITYK